MGDSKVKEQTYKNMKLEADQLTSSTDPADEDKAVEMSTKASEAKGDADRIAEKERAVKVQEEKLGKEREEAQEQSSKMEAEVLENKQKVKPVVSTAPPAVIKASHHDKKPEVPEKVACKTGIWSAWGRCTKTCGGGKQTRSRSVLREAEHGGTKCGALESSQSCGTVPCCYPNCPPDVSVKDVKDTTWFPPTGCECETGEACDMKALLVRGPAHTWPAQGGSHMWCKTLSVRPKCIHGWTWCSRKKHTTGSGSDWGPTKDPDQWPPRAEKRKRMQLKESQLPTQAYEEW